MLVPLLVQLFRLFMRKACVPDRWKVAKIIPLYKKGQLLDPGNYRSLQLMAPCTVCMLTCCLRLSQTGVKLGKIPDAQFGYYPGRNTLQPMFILGHWSMLLESKRSNCMQPSSTSSRHMILSLVKSCRSTFGASACLLTCCPSFKTCMQEMNMFWWMV